MSFYRAIVFDLDGTLIDSETINNQVLAESLMALGLPLTLDDIERTFLGLSLKDCIASVERDHGIAIQADFHDNLRQATFARYATDLRVIDHVPHMLADLASWPKAVASNSEADKIRFTLQAVGLLDHFAPHLYSYEDVARPKPHPDLYALASARLGAGIARTVAVEDSLVGVRAARAAGLMTFAYAKPDGDQAPAMAALGAILFDDMRALPHLIKNATPPLSLK